MGALPEILVADSDPEFISVIRRLLRRIADVVAAKDEREAIALLRERKFLAVVVERVLRGCHTIASNATLLSVIAKEQPRAPLLVTANHFDGDAITELARAFVAHGGHGVVPYLKSGDLTIVASFVLAAFKARPLTIEEAIRGLDPKEILTRRHHQVFALKCQGLDDKRIGVTLGIKPATVKTHLRDVRERLGFHSVLQAITAVLAEVVSRLPEMR